MQDLRKFLRAVQQSRTTRATRMNEAKEDGHGGSCHSHAALMLYLKQIDVDSENHTERPLSGRSIRSRMAVQNQRKMVLRWQGTNVHAVQGPRDIHRLPGPDDQL